MTLRILIADDERPARERVRALLGRIPDVEVVGEASDGASALASVTDLAPDVLLLDIEMPELTGLEVAASLQHAAAPPAVVFLTAYDEHALKAFDLAAVDYLLKPVEAPRLAAALDRARARRAKTTPDLSALLSQLTPTRLQRLAVRTGTRYVVCDLDQVAAVVARDDYAEILMGDRKLLVDDPLDALEARLPADRFLRIHRGALINLTYLQELRREGDRKYVAVLRNHFHSELAVSRERLRILLSRL